MKREIKSMKAPLPIGPYSQAIKVGSTLFISGQIAMEKSEGKELTIEEETYSVLQNIKAILTEAKLNLENVAKVSIFIKNMEQFHKINSVYSSFFEGVEVFPARETVEVSRLPKNVAIEISAIAVEF